jgi:hypothetical protein
MKHGHVSVSDTDTYDCIELCHFLKLLLVLTCEYQCLCPCFIANNKFVFDNQVIAQVVNKLNLRTDTREPVFKF